MQVVEKGVYLAYTSTLLFITKGQELTQELTPGGRRWCWVHGEVLLTSLHSLLSYRTQDHQPRDGGTHNRLGLCHHSLTIKMPYSWSLLEAFSQLRLLPLWWSLPQVGIQNQPVHPLLLSLSLTPTLCPSGANKPPLCWELGLGVSWAEFKVPSASRSIFVFCSWLIPETKHQGPAINIHYLTTLAELSNQVLPTHPIMDFPFSP